MGDQSLILYPTGAGGSFLYSLICEECPISHIKETNEYRIKRGAFDKSPFLPPVYGYYKNSVSKDDTNLLYYSVYYTHFTYWAKLFNPKMVWAIYSRDASVHAYCNALAGVKKNIDDKYLDMSYWWEEIVESLNSGRGYNYISYEDIFFLRKLEGTPWKGKEEAIKKYTKANLKILKKNSMGNLIPYKHLELGD